LDYFIEENELTNKKSGEEKTMTDKKAEESEKKKDVDEIITSHVIYSMTAGAIPVPLVDFVAITAIQIDMIKQVADFHGADYDRDKGKSLASSLTGASLAKIGASAVKSIPGVGTLLGISSQVILAGASTYALGKVFDSHFSENRSLVDFDTESMKKKYKQFMEKGKKITKDLKKKQKTEDVFATIEKLKALKESGAITEKDFERTKKDLLDKIKNQ
jgi:uncharacterized protein (DUF697 family)